MPEMITLSDELEQRRVNLKRNGTLAKVFSVAASGLVVSAVAWAGTMAMGQHSTPLHELTEGWRMAVMISIFGGLFQSALTRRFSEAVNDIRDGQKKAYANMALSQLGQAQERYLEELRQRPQDRRALSDEDYWALATFNAKEFEKFPAWMSAMDLVEIMCRKENMQSAESYFRSEGGKGMKVSPRSVEFDLAGALFMIAGLLPFKNLYRNFVENTFAVPASDSFKLPGPTVTDLKEIACKIAPQ